MSDDAVLVQRTGSDECLEVGDDELHVLADYVALGLEHGQFSGLVAGQSEADRLPVAVRVGADRELTLVSVALATQTAPTTQQ